MHIVLYTFPNSRSISWKQKEFLVQNVSYTVARFTKHVETLPNVLAQEEFKKYKTYGSFE